MRYMVFVKMAEDVGEAPAALQEAMGAEMGRMFAAGTMVDAGGLGSTAQSVEVRLSGGELTVTDGPFTEAKEFVGGYWIIQARSKEEAVEWASRAPLADGTIEVRQIAEGADYGPEIEEASRLSQTPPEQTVAD
jgi:hypothetical protein